MNFFSKPTEKILNLFFSTIGFRDPLIEDDSAVLPHIKNALKDTPYADLKIGEKAPGRYYEHAVRFLGSDHVVKFVQPAPEEVMRQWIENLREQKIILERYISHNLPSFSYFYVECGEAATFTRPQEERALKGATIKKEKGRKSPPLATYALVMEKIEGRPLYHLSDDEIFSNRRLVENLVEFLEGNRKMREERGIFADLIGGLPSKILQPRYTGNLYVTEENEVKLVDTVLIPNNYGYKKVPAKYRLAKLYHFCYNSFVLPRERALLKSLRKILKGL